MKISNLGEFNLISRLSKSLQLKLPENVLGIGDDCAMIPKIQKKSLLVTTDSLVEGVHFLKDTIDPYNLGHKSLAVNLSDIAAMGGTPTYAFISMAMPKSTDLKWVDKFYEGFNFLAKNHGVAVLGGDTTRSHNSIFINITLLGEIAPTQVKLRSSAKTGDLICVSGFLGDSAGGLEIILKNLPTNSAEMKYLQDRHYCPNPQIAEGQWLAEREEVHAMMDISDGIDSDIQRIMEQSSCGAQIYLEKIPISKPLQICSEKFNWNIFELAVTGGEDYCLLLTIDRLSHTKISSNFEKKFGFSLCAIGEITANQGQLTYTLDNHPYIFTSSGFDHFKNKRSKSTKSLI